MRTIQGILTALALSVLALPACGPGGDEGGFVLPADHRIEVVTDLESVLAAVEAERETGLLLNLWAMW